MADNHSEEREERLVSYLASAREKHFKFVPSGLPDFIGVDIDTDVPLFMWGITLVKGLYFLKEGDNGITAPIYTFSLDNFSLDNDVIETAIRDAEERGSSELDSSIRFNATLRPVMVEGRPLKFLEVLAFAAINDAEDQKTAEDILHTAFDISDDSEKTYTRRKSHNIRTTRQMALIDPLTNAITDSSNGAITPADYFTDEGREIDTGNGGVALLDIRAGDDADLEDVSTYVADNNTRYWLDHLYPLVLDSADNGYEVHGSELLKHAGIANPYDKKQESVMRNAAKNIDKALKTRIGIDVTHEKRNKRGKNKNLIESIELRPIVDGIMTIDRYDEDGEEVRDFTITVKPRVGEEVIDALPLAKYAQSRGMLTNYTQDEITFSGIRQTLDDRRMWAYVLRRIKTRGMSGTIKFETMWNDLQVDEGPSKESRRKKRARMLDKLERMLDQKKGELFASWTWKKDADGRVEGIQIRRKKN